MDIADELKILIEQKANLDMRIAALEAQGGKVKDFIQYVSDSAPELQTGSFQDVANLIDLWEKFKSGAIKAEPAQPVPAVAVNG